MCTKWSLEVIGGGKVRVRKQGEGMSRVVPGYYGEPVQLGLINKALNCYTLEGFNYTSTNEVTQARLESDIP